MCHLGLKLEIIHISIFYMYDINRLEINVN